MIAAARQSLLPRYPREVNVTMPFAELRQEAIQAIYGRKTE
jgi:hypothetical protein